MATNPKYIKEKDEIESGQEKNNTIQLHLL